MTAPTDQFVDIAKRSQEAFNTVTRGWVDSMQSFAGNVMSAESKDAQAYVDELFDFAEKVLGDQREIAHQLINATMRATGTVAEQTTRATKSILAQATHSAEAVAGSNGDAAKSKAAEEKTVSSPRATRTAPER